MKDCRCLTPAGRRAEAEAASAGSAGGAGHVPVSHRNWSGRGGRGGRSAGAGGRVCGKRKPLVLKPVMRTTGKHRAGQGPRGHSAAQERAHRVGRTEGPVGSAARPRQDSDRMGARAGRVATRPRASRVGFSTKQNGRWPPTSPLRFKPHQARRSPPPEPLARPEPQHGPGQKALTRRTPRACVLGTRIPTPPGAPPIGRLAGRAETGIFESLSGLGREPRL